MEKEQKLKIKLGRQKYLDEKVGLVCQIDDDIKIFVDVYQYILKIGDGSKHTYYFSSIEQVIEELMDLKSKEIMLQKEDKSLESVHQSIREAKKWLAEILEPLFSKHIDRKS